MHQITRYTLWSDDLFELYLPDIDNDSIKKYYTEKRTQFPNGIRRSNRGGWQYDVPSGECEALDFLTLQLEKYAQHIFYDNFKFNFEIRLGLCWLNCNDKHSSNGMHTHPGAIFAGVYYIDVENKYDQGVIQFFRNDRVEFTLDKANDYTDDRLFATNVEFIPRKSYAYLFAPWTMHEVQPNQLDNERLVLGFNFIRANKMKDSIQENSLIR